MLGSAAVRARRPSYPPTLSFHSLSGQHLRCRDSIRLRIRGQLRLPMHHPPDRSARDGCWGERWPACNAAPRGFPPRAQMCPTLPTPRCYITLTQAQRLVRSEGTCGRRPTRWARGEAGCPRSPEGRGIRSPNLLIWSQTRCRCTIPPLAMRKLTASVVGLVPLIGSGQRSEAPWARKKRKKQKL